MTPPSRTIQACWSLNRSTTLPSSKSSGKPTLIRLGGSTSTLGYRKRSVPSVISPSEAVIAPQAKANGLRNRVARNERRSGLLALGAGFGAVAGRGAAGTAGVGVTPPGVAPVAPAVAPVAAAVA